MAPSPNAYVQNKNIYMNKRMYLETPLFQTKTGKSPASIWFKMECYQPTGSFKIRGMEYAVSYYKQQGYKSFVASSGGNAGYSLAYVCSELHIPLTVYVPLSTSESMVRRIQSTGATVIQIGDFFHEADFHARNEVKKTGAAYISPFDDPLLWQGHSTVIDECCRAMQEPDKLIVSVGGGGFLCGILEGLERNQWNKVQVIAAETEGAASFQAGKEVGYPVEINLDTIATSLAAKKVATEAVEWSKKRKIDSFIVTDKQAVLASYSLAKQYNIITEPACGAALAYIYNDNIISNTKENIMVCGGVNYDIDSFHSIVKRYR
jgi:L-serine/L-threonine ammonia-lyase